MVRILSFNTGNVALSAKDYTFSLADEELAREIGGWIQAHDFDICLIQEMWDFTEELFQNEYETCGLNDCIAVAKSFGKIIPGTFTQHAERFKKRERTTGETIPSGNQEEISLDFDITYCGIETHSQDKIALANVHIVSGFNDEERARQLQEWILEDFFPFCEANDYPHIIIAGDFNFDSTKDSDSLSGQVFQKILEEKQLTDCAVEFGQEDRQTTNIPFFNKRLDHLLGNVGFTDYKVGFPDNDPFWKGFKKKHRLTWFLHLDHRPIWAEFELNQK